MKSKQKVVSQEELIPSLLKLLEETDCVPLVISGGSMTPFLVHNRDTVYLSRIRRNLKCGDMVLYRRENGHYVLHRIFKAENGTFTLVGDAQTVLEYGVRQEQMLALVSAVHRKGKLLQSGSFWWEFFQRVWIHLVPVRPVFLSIYTTAVRLFRHQNGD